MVMDASTLDAVTTDASMGDGGTLDAQAQDAQGGMDTGVLATAHPICHDTAADIVPTPESESSLRGVGLNRMLTLPLAGGGQVRFFAQDGVSDAQLLLARRVFQFYMTDAPGTMYGADKRAVATSLAANNATLVFFNTQADSERALSSLRPDGVWQDLYATESPVEGSRDYLGNTVRDATYEELFHLLQGAGIQPAVAAYQTQIEEATAAALANNVWTPPADVLAEWRGEGSESFEYIISVIDVFYGLWEHAPPPSFHGEYQLATRASLSAQDPLGLAAVRAFLPDDNGHWAELDPSFEGTFSLVLDGTEAYTLKSQHLRDVGLSGGADSSILGNAMDNTLRGNGGANTLDGGEGEDTVIYCQPRGAYTLTEEAGATVVTGPDGRDVLRNVERVQFADEMVSL